VIFALGASFTNWDLQRSVPFAFIGLENFRRMFHSEEFWIYFVNTFYLMLGLPFSIAGALVLAMLLNQKLRGISAYRTFFYLPSFTSGVALMILWVKLYNPEFGPINVALKAVSTRCTSTRSRRRGSSPRRTSSPFARSIWDSTRACSVSGRARR
jgi:multiple sugar transport system permease protein